MTSMSRKAKILIVTCVVVLIVCAGAIVVIGQQERVSNTPPVTSEDTAETNDGIPKTDLGLSVQYDPADSSGIVLEPSKVFSTVLYGIPSYTQALLSQHSHIRNTLRDTESALFKYGDTFLDKKYPSITILPNETTVDTSAIKGSLRLGKSSTIVKFTADIKKSGHAYISIDDPSSDKPFIYIGGLNDISSDVLKAEQTNMKEGSILITTSNKEKALSYIKSLGYKVPDLSLSFADYRSPF